MLQPSALLGTSPSSKAHRCVPLPVHFQHSHCSARQPAQCCALVDVSCVTASVTCTPLSSRVVRVLSEPQVPHGRLKPPRCSAQDECLLFSLCWSQGASRCHTLHYNLESQHNCRLLLFLSLLWLPDFARVRLLHRPGPILFTV